jgi:hypothetical protein
VCTLTPLRSIIETAIGDAAGAAEYRYRYLKIETAPA